MSDNARAQQPEAPASNPPEPLMPSEMEGLWRWERWVGWLHIAGMGMLLLSVLVAYRLGDIAWLRPALLGGVLAFLGAASLLQTRGRCPRCKSRLRSSILKVLPAKCARCGVLFPRPASEG